MCASMEASLMLLLSYFPDFPLLPSPFLENASHLSPSPTVSVCSDKTVKIWLSKVWRKRWQRKWQTAFDHFFPCGSHSHHQGNFIFIGHCENLNIALKGKNQPLFILLLLISLLFFFAFETWKCHLSWCHSDNANASCRRIWQHLFSHHNKMASAMLFPLLFWVGGGVKIEIHMEHLCKYLQFLQKRIFIFLTVIIIRIQLLRN